MEPSLQPGALIARRFRCTGLIARGGMGAVYAARDERLDRQVALKVLRSELGEDPVLIARFQREAIAAARLAHPGIAQVLDFGTTDEGLSYLVMELIQGETFSALLTREKRLAPHRAADLVEQALGALASAHDAGIVHRDLKPGNLMVVPTGASRETVKVLDFGIAQIADGEAYTRLTRTGIILGTPAYMAPEQAMGRGVDARTDVYAMGVILWCLLTGQKPFTGADMASVLEALLHSVPPRADQLASGVPPELASIAELAMQKEPERRFQSATAMAQALVALRSHEQRAGSMVPPQPRAVSSLPEPPLLEQSLLERSRTSLPHQEAPRASLPHLESPAPRASRLEGLAAPAPSLRSRMDRARAALASRRSLAPVLGLLALVGACVIGAGLVITPTYFVVSYWTALAPWLPAWAAPTSSPAPAGSPSPTPGNAQRAPMQGASSNQPPAAQDTLVECARTARCCEAYSAHTGDDPAMCAYYDADPQLYFSTARCVGIRGDFRAALVATGADPSACEP